jgi:hypothetical protein
VSVTRPAWSVMSSAESVIELPLYVSPTSCTTRVYEEGHPGVAHRARAPMC